MDPPKSTLSQKEYLRRYLMKDKGKKKKKKSTVSSSSHLKRSVIIDDDINLSDIPHGDNEDFNLDHLGEEAPQIAGYIDERPEEVKLAEKYDSGKWKPFSVDAETNDSPNNISTSPTHINSADRDLSPPRRRRSPLVPLESSASKTDNQSNESRFDKQSHKRRSDVKVSSNRDSDSDLELPRKRREREKPDGNRYGDKRSKSNRSYDSDHSPPRRHKQRRSPQRERIRRRSRSRDLSPPRRSNRSTSDETDEKRKKAQRALSEGKEEQMHDGKKAGLQDAKSLKNELRALKERENEVFRKMNPELLGRSSAAIVRDRKTGLKRNFEKEKELEREAAAKDAVRRKKYEKWGQGLKQVRDQEEKVADMVYEMSKPMARYADDNDLERALKAQEREGDPMLDYIRRHQKESHTIDLTMGGDRKKYMGSYLPNRFNAVPGHRWDGVDRSNGYEQKWFAAKNAKRAVEEEAWKWSSADM